jgi:hypothetical protein
VIIVEGNGTIRIILINMKLGVETRRPQVFICYDLMEGRTNEEDIIFEIGPNLFSIGTIIISDETISLLNVGIIKIKING